MLFTKQIAEATARADAAEGKFTGLKAALESGGHFALATNAEGKFELSLTDAGKTHFAAGVTDLTTKLEDATASVQALTTEKLGLEAKLEAGKAVATERDGLRAAINADGAFDLKSLDGGKFELALTEVGKTKFVNAEVTRTLAASGHAPLPVAVDTPAPGNQPANANSGEGRTKSTWGKKF